MVWSKTSSEFSVVTDDVDIKMDVIIWICQSQMVRSKSSGHLSESRSNLLGPSPVGERFHPGERFYLILLINLYLVSIALIIILHNRFHPRERFAFAERLSLGENRAGTNTSLPTSRFIFTVILTVCFWDGHVHCHGHGHSSPIPSSFPNLPLPP